MFFDYGLHVSLALCAAGLAYKVWGWLSAKVGPEGAEFSPAARALWALRGVVGLLLGARAFKFVWALIVDGLLQRRVLRASAYRWVMHMCIFVGFVLLTLLHAMGPIVSNALFGDYQATLNPFLFLRNLFGLMVLLGVGMAIWRRLRAPGVRATNRGVDVLAIVVVALIIFSGFALEALKIDSPREFERMVAEYADPEAADEVAALRLFWSRDYGVVFAKDQTPAFSPELYDQGRQLSEDSCLSCHDKPAWAFASFGLARLIRPAAVALAESGAAEGLWFIHVLACFVGLALLPHTKFMHLISSPLIIAINAANERAAMHPANRATVRAMELDACTHCAACSVRCSVAAAMAQVANPAILPSEKLHALARMAHGKGLDQHDLRRIRQGADICTDCHRCTDLCPVRINLQDLWQAQKQDLERAGQGETFKALRDRAVSAAQPSRQQKVVRLGQRQFGAGLDLSGRAQSFAGCFRCKTCTTVCPVVQECADVKAEIDLAPHQIMHALGLGLREEALGARMIWNCLSCYRCQEACPQGVRVTDIMFELTNLAGRDGQVKEA